MADKKLTKRDIDAFIYEGGWDVRWDTTIPGLGVRIYPTGKKAYILSYRNDKRAKKYLTIGQTSKITLDQARDQALKHLGKIVDKADPAQERKAQSSGHTTAQAFDDFLTKYAQLHNRSWKETERIFKNDVLPTIGKKPISEVTKQDIIKLIDKVTSRGSLTMANRMLANLKKFFGWCAERDLIEHSPIEKMSKPAPEESRDRVLTDEEIKALWQSCEEEGYPYGSLVQLLLVTAQRKNEVATMQWQHIDFKEGIWTLPKADTKSNRQHHVPLSPLSLKILRKAREHTVENSAYVFTTAGNVPFSGFSKAKIRLDNTLRFPEWRIHDLRRTASSGMARLSIPQHIVERILNHSSGVISGVSAVYNRYDYKDECLNALVLWGERLQALVNTPAGHKKI